MSSVLYYSNFCENSKKLLLNIANTSIKKDIHFICIDNRIKQDNKTYIVLENNCHVLLPPSINAVPALMLINNNYRVLYGDQILEYLKPMQEVAVKQALPNNNNDPSSYSLGQKYDNVSSDNYSFLDQSDLSAKGDGGMRQLYNYATLDHTDSITTPPEDYTPNKVNDSEYENFKNSRN